MISSTRLYAFYHRTAIVCLAVVACSGLAVAQVTTEPSEKITPRWVDRVYIWRYNPESEPAWLTPGEALTMIQQATRSWEACGITFHYNGLSNKSPGKMDGENVIGWKDDGRNYSAWTSWHVMRSSQAIEADVTLYANIFNTYRHQNIDAKLELRKSIIHELGHVLGLSHSEQRGDAMMVKVRTRPEWKMPSDNDISQCRARYSGQSLALELIPAKTLPDY